MIVIKELKWSSTRVKYIIGVNRKGVSKNETPFPKPNSLSA